MYLTRYAAVHVDPCLPTPLWDETLANLCSTVRDDRALDLDEERLRFVRGALGISVFGNAARHVFVFDGPSGTVKSTFAGAVQYVLGDVACALPTSVLCA